MNVRHSMLVSARVGATAVRPRTCLDLRNFKYIRGSRRARVTWLPFVAIELKTVWPRGTFNWTWPSASPVSRLHKKRAVGIRALPPGFHPHLGSSRNRCAYIRKTKCVQTKTKATKTNRVGRRYQRSRFSVPPCSVCSSAVRLT